MGLQLYLYSADFFAVNFTPYENAYIGMRLDSGTQVL